MDIKQLKYFISLCNSGSFSVSSRELFISRQGLSLAINRLEDELGCRLFTRVPRGIQPTEDGLWLLQHANIIADEIDLCGYHFSKGISFSEELPVSCGIGTVARYCGDFFSEFEQEFPSVKLTVVDVADRKVEEMVMNSEAEIGYAIGPVDQTVFESIPVFRDHICLIVPDGHPYASKVAADISMLKGEPVSIIGKHCKVNELVRNCARKNGFVPSILYEVLEVSTVHNLVKGKKSLGISVEAYARFADDAGIAILPFDDPLMNWDINLITKKGRTLSNAARLLIDYTRSSLKNA